MKAFMKDQIDFKDNNTDSTLCQEDKSSSKPPKDPGKQEIASIDLMSHGDTGFVFRIKEGMVHILDHQ